MWNDNEKNVLVLGHRGMKALYPENTMVSFKAALDARVDLIEMDVHLTSDNVLVICHDHTVDRTTDGTGSITEKTLAEVKDLDAGIKFSPRFKGERVPTFKEFLELIKTADYEVLLNVEIKDYRPECCDATVEMLKEYGLLERSVIASFSADVIRYIYGKYPGVKLQGFPGRYMENFTEDVYDMMYGMGIPGEWQSWIKDTAEDVDGYVALAKSKGIKPWLFCSDTEETVKAAVAHGTYNVTGNDPYPALRYLPTVGLHAPVYPNEPVTGKMNTCNLHAVGDLVYEQFDIPECGDDEVLVKVKMCGICGSDVPRAMKKGTYHFPTVIGHEFAGKVVYDKSGEYTGKRVAVFPLLPCFKCENCKEQNYAQCLDYDYYGSRRDGGLAEYIAVKKFNLIELPDNVTYEEGAMSEPISVANHAVKKLEIKGGENLLITGAGPIGLIAGMWAKKFGVANVYYIDIDQGKLDFAKELGFDVYTPDLHIDMAIEGTGVGAPLGSIINAVKAKGRVVLMGNPGDQVALDGKTYQNILRKELVVVGTWNSSYAEKENDWIEALAAVSKGELALRQLITHSVSLADAADAIKMMYERKEFYCKVMIDNEK